MSPLTQAVVSIAAVLLIGNALILAHELGHYGTARLLGVTASRFTIGIGPTLVYRRDARGTEWKLALLPVGGFVSFPGEHDRSKAGSYAAQPPLIRMGIIAAGPAVNLLVAFIVFAGLQLVQGRSVLLPIVTRVIPHSAAAVAGFRVDDRILTAEGTPTEYFDDLRPALQVAAGRILTFRVDRGGSTINLSAHLGSLNHDGRAVGFLGIETNHRVFVSETPAAALRSATGKTWHAVSDTVAGIARAVTTGRGAQNFEGVIGITQLAGQAAIAGDTSIFTLLAILSANLALMDLLPIPVLDGGGIVFCALEWVRGRPLSLQLQGLATRTGLAALLAMFLLSMLHDLSGFHLFQ